MIKKLTEQERIDLQRQHKKERDKRICDRIKAVLAFDDGYNYSEIARILLLDDETIRRHIHAYFSSQKLTPESGGSEGYLTVSETNLLTAQLAHKTYLHVKDICAYVAQCFGKVYTVSWMTNRYRQIVGVDLWQI